MSVPATSRPRREWSFAPTGWGPYPIATTSMRTVTDVVCDNTRELALAETGQQVKVKHSRYSTFKLAAARHQRALRT